MRGAQITYADMLFKNLIPVTLGNIVGGAGCVGLGYASVYGSLLERVGALRRSAMGALTTSPSPTKATPGSPYKVMNIRGGFTTTRPSMVTIGRAATALYETRSGSSYLPPETLERAKVGNNIEKIKQKKDGVELWTDIVEYAKAIREGETNWYEGVCLLLVVLLLLRLLLSFRSRTLLS